MGNWLEYTISSVPKGPVMSSFGGKRRLDALNLWKICMKPVLLELNTGKPRPRLRISKTSWELNTIPRTISKRPLNMSILTTTSLWKNTWLEWELSRIPTGKICRCFGIGGESIVPLGNLLSTNSETHIIRQATPKPISGAPLKSGEMAQINYKPHSGNYQLKLYKISLWRPLSRLLNVATRLPKISPYRTTCWSKETNSWDTMLRVRSLQWLSLKIGQFLQRCRLGADGTA